MSGAMKRQGLRRFMPYPEYKDSGVEWLGEIPAHWSAFAFRRLIRRIEQGWSPVAEDRLAGLDEWAVIKLSAVNKGRFLPDEHKALPAHLAPDTRYEIREGDLLLTRANTPDRVGDVCVARGTRPKLMLCDLVYRLLLRDDRLSPTFLAYWLVSSVGRHQIEVDARGSSQSMVKVSQGHIRAWTLLLPPEEEQRAIAAFLDRETARIDGLVAKKERLIQLLEEKRASLITRAVTKGSDPNAPVKDSGFEWLGQIPASWSLARLKRLVTRVEQGWSPLCENRQADDHEWGVLKVGCVNGMEFDGTENKALPPDLDPLEDFEIAPGDILMSRANTRQLLGSAALVRLVRPRLLLCDKLYRIRVRSELVLPSFLVHAFSSSLSRFQFEREATGASASMQNISQQMILELLVPCPPPEEQQRIVELVERDTAQLSGLIERIGGAVARLKELRSALISAAVTGKIDVRAA